MKKNDIEFYQLYFSGAKNYKKEKIIRIPEGRMYIISLQPAIWKRQTFLEYLRTIQSSGGKSPWDFERYFVTKRKEGISISLIDKSRYDLRDILGYKNGILQGKWIRATIAFYKKNGIELDLGTRKVMSVKDTLMYDIKKRAAAIQNPRIKSGIKNILKKLE